MLMLPIALRYWCDDDHARDYFVRSGAFHLRGSIFFTSFGYFGDARREEEPVVTRKCAYVPDPGGVGNWISHKACPEEGRLVRLIGDKSGS